MQVTLTWWIFPGVLLLIAIALVVRAGTKPRLGDYDMFTGVPELAVAFACVVGAAGVFIGHFGR